MTAEEKKYYDKTYYKLLESLEWDQPETVFRKFKRALKEGFPVDYCPYDNRKNDPLLIAIVTYSDPNFLDILDLVLAHGSDPNIKNFEGNAALHISVALCCPNELFDVLLKAGADPNIKNKWEIMPLDVLCRHFLRCSPSDRWRKLSLLEYINSLLMYGAKPEISPIMKREIQKSIATADANLKLYYQKTFDFLCNFLSGNAGKNFPSNSTEIMFADAGFPAAVIPLRSTSQRKRA